MNVAIAAIGDELLIGQVVNTNAAWLGTTLTDAGMAVEKMVTVADTEESIRGLLDEHLDTFDLLIVTGGLGPTHDDITKQVLADYFNRSLQFHENIFEEIRRRFEARGIPLARSNRGQAMVPEGFEPLNNPIGTAPGLWCDYEREQGTGSIACLPGVPSEMKRIVQESVLPRLRERIGGRNIIRRTLLTTGIGESNLNEELGDLSEYLSQDVRLAFLPGPQGVRLRLTAIVSDDPSPERRMEKLESVIRERAGTYVYGSGEETLQSVVADLLREHGMTVSVAESCTGGLVLSRLTDVPGSSDYVAGGVVAYSNEVKVALLGVPQDTLGAHGAVSRQVATEMARGVRRALGTSVGLATSGILGPGGGTEEKPVGTVWIGLSDDSGATASLLRLGLDRETNKERTVAAVLNLLRRRLVKTFGASGEEGT
jgi:nicotinamide-nucleotide amidase